jgi:hypothetical protein
MTLRTVLLYELNFIYTFIYFLYLYYFSETIKIIKTLEVRNQRKTLQRRHRVFPYGNKQQYGIYDLCFVNHYKIYYYILLLFILY